MASLLSVFITERYRLAAVPGLMLFGAFALCHLWRSIVFSRYVPAAVCASLALVFSFVTSTRRGEAELWALDPYNSGLQAFEAGRHDVAERKLRLAYAYVPNNAELNFALGNLHLTRGEQRQATEFYTRTLQLAGQHEGAFNNLGLMALDDERWDAAATLFTSALTLEPNDPKTRYLLARALFGGGEIDAAAREIRRSLELAPAQPEFLQLEEQIRAAAAPDS